MVPPISHIDGDLAGAWHVLVTRDSDGQDAAYADADADADASQRMMSPVEEMVDRMVCFHQSRGPTVLGSSMSPRLM
jgi:hypothetical protein